MAALRAGRVFERYTPAVPGTFRSTVGLLGLGQIGRLVARRLAALDVRVIASDPFVAADEARRLGVTLAGLDEVFATADVVSCHMPLTEDTRHALGREQFAAMKAGATFINTARGAIVREAELVAVLVARPDLCAVLDVMEHEPPPAGCPLLALPNVIATPHIAGSIGQECRRLGLTMVDEVCRYVNDEPLLGEISRQQMPMLA
jgi:phosphoglycerate dehydrogenase-like enzyme